MADHFVGNLIRRVYYSKQSKAFEKSYKELIETTASVNLSGILENACECELLITNSNGGGTAQYTKAYKSNSKALIVLKFLNNPYLRKRTSENEGKYEISQGDKKKIISAEDLGRVFAERYNRITVNTLVECPDYIRIIKGIIENKKANPDTFICALVHDYYLVCPNYNLFDGDNYCEMQCEKCDVNLSVCGNRILIEEWRGHFGALLDVCQEIRCFSESSKRIILEAYRDIKEELITVIPHDISYIPFKRIEGIESLDFHLGIVGDCMGSPKGKYLVKELIKKYGNKIPITLIGSDFLHFRVVRKKVKYLGPYKRDDLEEIIRNRKVSCVLFPSLCPETFSFLISELMAMDIPIICFPYGAQEEKVSQYKRGSICQNKDALWDFINERIKKQE